MENEYEIRLDILRNHMEQFQRLETDAPEIAAKLGFSGYVQMATLEFYGNEQYEQLQEIYADVNMIKAEVISLSSNPI